MSNAYVDEGKLRQALTILKPNNTLFEIRILKKPKQTLSGYFRDVDTAIDAIMAQDLRNANVFFTLNSIKAACYDRLQHDRIITPENTTADGEIEAYSWLLIDLDPVRPTGVSSSDDELTAARHKARKIYAYLKEEGFEEPVVAMSGNGVHLLYAVSLANNEENAKMVENFLKSVDLMFSDEQIKVDTANFNPSRICKMYGSLAQKGAGTDDRPHRMSYIMNAPASIKPTRRAYIQKIADLLPKPEKPQAYNNYRPREFDIVQWMDDHGIRYSKKSGVEYTKYVLDECPFDSNHKAPDSMITVGKMGAIGFKCLHNSCSCYTWKDVRIKYEPDAYDRNERENENDARIDAGWREHKKFNRDQELEYKELNEADEPEKPVFLTAMDIFKQPEETEVRIPTGIDGIDNRLAGGLKKGAVTVVSGLRGGSKSTLLSGVILNAINEGYNVICYSGELTSKNFMRWMNLQAAGKTYVKPTSYDVEYVVPDSVRELIAKWMGDHFLLYENDYGNNFTKLYQRLERQVAIQKTDMIVLDNLMTLDVRELDYNQLDAQTRFVNMLCELAKRTQTHIIFVAHPRKASGFLRLEDISGSNNIVQRVDNALIVHRKNEDFMRLTKEMFKWPDGAAVYRGTNVIEIAKERDFGTMDVFIPLWYEKETKRLKNSEAEMIRYKWEPGDFIQSDEFDFPM